MKKFIFPLLVLLLVAALASCGLNPMPDGGDAPRGGSDDDGDSPRELPRYVTMRFADHGEYENDTIGIGLGNTVAADAANTRALNLDNAQAFHDFFEAVFYYNTGSNSTSTIARVAWDVGETPELRGVYRTNGGTSYDSVSGAPGGSAVLFAGTKSDKTLLAIGRLCEVDGIGLTNTPSVSVPSINTDTRSVTFEVTALKAGTSYTAANSSFKTYRTFTAGSPTAPPTFGSESTVIESGIYLHDVNKTFPLYKLGGIGSDNARYGAYEFVVDSAGLQNTSFNDYAAGIVLAGGWNLEARNPRYLIVDGLYQYSSLLVQDIGMRLGGQLTLQNNNVKVGEGNPAYNPTTTAQPFRNPVAFQIDNSASKDGSVFALVFEIFVYNLSALPAAADGPDAVKWRISPGYDNKWLDLDNGLGGEGGAVFLGSGDVAAYLNQAGNMPRP